MRQKPNLTSGISIISLCPVCKGKGRLLRGIPPLANAKAPATRNGSFGFRVCPRCKGKGRIGI